MTKLANSFLAVGGVLLFIEFIALDVIQGWVTFLGNNDPYEDHTLGLIMGKPNSWILPAFGLSCLFFGTSLRLLIWLRKR